MSSDRFFELGERVFKLERIITTGGHETTISMAFNEARTGLVYGRGRIGEMSPLARYQAEDASEAGCVVFSRSELRLLPDSNDDIPAPPKHEMLSRVEHPSHATIQNPIPHPHSLINHGPSAQALRQVICQLVATRFMNHGYEKYQLKLSSRGANRNGQVSQGAGPPPAAPNQLVLPSGSRRRALETSETDQETVDQSANESDGRGRKRRRVHPLRRLYACPFYRKDPTGGDFLDGKSFEKCRTHGIKTDKLKEHIRRKHTKPAQCPICGLRADSIRAHLKKVACVSSGPIEKVEEDILEKDRLLTRQRNISWHQVFAILFPDHRPIPPAGSQYFEDGDHFRKRLGDTLAAHLEQTANVLEALLSSQEYREINPNSVTADSSALAAAAARLVAIISSGPFVAYPSAAVTQVPAVSDNPAESSPQIDAPTPLTSAVGVSNNTQVGSTVLSNLTHNALSTLHLCVGQILGGDDETVADQGAANGIAQHFQFPLDDADWESVNWDALIEGGWFNPDTVGEI